MKRTRLYLQAAADGGQTDRELGREFDTERTDNMEAMGLLMEEIKEKQTACKRLYQPLEEGFGVAEEQVAYGRRSGRKPAFTINEALAYMRYLSSLEEDEMRRTFCKVFGEENVWTALDLTLKMVFEGLVEFSQRHMGELVELMSHVEKHSIAPEDIPEPEEGRYITGGEDEESVLPQEVLEMDPKLISPLLMNHYMMQTSLAPSHRFSKEELQSLQMVGAKKREVKQKADRRRQVMEGPDDIFALNVDGDKMLNMLRRLYWSTDENNERKFRFALTWAMVFGMLKKRGLLKSDRQMASNFADWVNRFVIGTEKGEKKLRKKSLNNAPAYLKEASWESLKKNGAADSSYGVIFKMLEGALNKM